MSNHLGPMLSMDELGLIAKILKAIHTAEAHRLSEKFEKFFRDSENAQNPTVDQDKWAKFTDVEIQVIVGSGMHPDNPIRQEAQAELQRRLREPEIYQQINFTRWAFLTEGERRLLLALTGYSEDELLNELRASLWP